MPTSEQNQDNEYYYIPDTQEVEKKIDPMQATLDLLAQTQARLAEKNDRIESALGAISNNLARPAAPPQVVYTPPVQPMDPLSSMQSVIDNEKSVLEQALRSGEIDQTQYWTAFQERISPKVNQLQQMRYQSDIDKAREDAKTDAKQLFDSQKAELDAVKAMLEKRTYDEKLMKIQTDFGGAMDENSELFKEMSRIAGEYGQIYSNASKDPDTYYLLAKHASENLGRTLPTAKSQVANMGAVGNPGQYNPGNQNQTALTKHDVEVLRQAVGSHVDRPEFAQKMSGYMQAYQQNGQITLMGWTLKNAR
jgi:hypothetical protein